jgi:putative acetyltransferase
MVEGEMEIRRERLGDEARIHDVNAAAFGREGEAALVDALRANGKLVLSLVAEADGEVVAHVAFSPAVIELPQAKLDVLALGPVAVLPEHQRKGIGSRLIQRGFDECRALGHNLIFLLGHPTYYPRLGFKPAKPLGVRWSGDSSDGDCEPFMVYELQAEALAHQLNGRQGVFWFAKEFDEV